MNYLTELAGKLVTAYQDRENLTLWLAPGQSQDTQRVLASALQAVLEKEIAGGRLQYVRIDGEENAAIPPLIDSLEGKERRAVG